MLPTSFLIFPVNSEYPDKRGLCRHTAFFPADTYSADNAARQRFSTVLSS